MLIYIWDTNPPGPVRSTVSEGDHLPFCLVQWRAEEGPEEIAISRQHDLVSPDLGAEHVDGDITELVGLAELEEI